MTHIDNVTHIMQYGITHISSANRSNNYTPIGDSSLISKRHYVFPIPNKQLSDYIPFYFWGRMPMLYVVQNGFNGVKQLQAEEIVYFVTTVDEIIKHKLDFLFSDKHAVTKFAKFYASDLIGDIDKIIDLNAIKADNWKKEGDNDFKARKEAEFLIESDIPYSTLVAFIVYNEKAKQKLLNLGIAEEKIKINPKHYF